MSSPVNILSINAKSEVPLYVYIPGVGRRFANTTTWQTLWAAPNNPTAYAFAAWNCLPPPGVSANLSVVCTFNSAYNGQTLILEGLLNGASVVQCAVTVNGTRQHTLNNFIRINTRPFPVSYRGYWQWRLWRNGIVLGGFATLTFVEVYSIIAPSASLWSPYGVSVNLLRLYVPIWGTFVAGWSLAQFYSWFVTFIHSGPSQYDVVAGQTRYSTNLGQYYRLEQYCDELERRVSVKVNCYDMAGIVQIILSLCPYYSSVRWNFLEPYGYINTTRLVGWTATPCNNPFWGNSSSWDNRPLVPVNWAPGLRLRSAFGNHAYVVAPGGNVLDSCGGPHLGNESLDTYLTSAIDHATNYYSYFPSNGPGKKTNISLSQNGVTSLAYLSISSQSPPTSQEGISSTPFGNPPPPTEDIETMRPAIFATPTKMAGSVSFEAIEHTASTFVEDSAPITVDDAIERARVKDADDVSFTHVDPSALKSLLEEKSGMKIILESMASRAGGSEVLWTSGAPPLGVEATIVAASSHEAAIEEMKVALWSFSAPLDMIFAQKLHLGQFCLQRIAGNGLFLFIRGNILVKLTGLTNSDDLGRIAIDVDRFLADRHAQPDSVLGPRILREQISPRRVKEGETFEVVVDAMDVGWMTASADPAKVQLLEVDSARGAFVFCAGSKGEVDVEMLFAHRSTLQTETAMLRIEIFEDAKGEVNDVEDTKEGVVCGCMPFSNERIEKLAGGGVNGTCRWLWGGVKNWCKACISLGRNNVERKDKF